MKLYVLHQKEYAGNEIQNTSVVGVFENLDRVYDVALTKANIVAELSGTAKINEFPDDKNYISVQIRESSGTYVKYQYDEIEQDEVLSHRLPSIPFCNRDDFAEAGWDFGDETKRITIDRVSVRQRRKNGRK